MGFGNSNTFSRIFNVISSKKMPFLLTYTVHWLRTVKFFPPAESWLVNSNFSCSSHMQGMSEETLTTCRGFICAKILPLHILPPSPTETTWLETCYPVENQYLVSSQLKETTQPQWALALSLQHGQMICWSINHNRDVQCQRCTLVMVLLSYFSRFWACHTEVQGSGC